MRTRRIVGPKAKSTKIGEQAAFTLAEVLITLGIIGVVAAMTLPTLVANYREKQIVTQLAKSYSVLSQAWQMMQAEYGELSTWNLVDTEIENPDSDDNKYDHSAQDLIAQRLKKYLNVTKTCTPNVVCDTRPAYRLNGEKVRDNLTFTPSSDSSANAAFFLNDGTFVYFGWYQNGALPYFPKGYVDIIVTLPGGKDRTRGKNEFFFKAGDKGVIPEGDKRSLSPSSSATLFENYCNLTISTNLSGRGCAAWVITNKNLDYLHCPDKLGWNKASSCKE